MWIYDSQTVDQLVSRNSTNCGTVDNNTRYVGFNMFIDLIVVAIYYVFITRLGLEYSL